MNTGPQNTFRALADPTRRSILLMLGESDLSIQDVASHFDMTRAAVKKHLSVLQEGELISVRASGRERINHLEPAALKAVSDWFAYFDQFWESKLSKLQQAIEKDKTS